MRRRRLTVLHLVVGAAVLTTAIACTPDAEHRDGTAATGAPGTAAPAGTMPAEDATGYAVGTVWLDLTDDVRGRALRTLVHYPAEGPSGADGTTPAAGAFPVVLLAHGYLLPAAGYEQILRALTTAGYLTVAPAFPHTSAEVGDGQRGDIVNQPADLSAVLDQVVALAGEPDGLLPAVADPERVGAIGHSDGGLTVAALAYNARYHDPRVAAAVVLTGGRALFDGSYFDVADPAPLLAVHGTADGNPYDASQRLVQDAAAAGAPAYLLTIEGGGHIEPYMFATARPELAAAIVAFMDATLGHRTGALDDLLAVDDEAADLRLEAG